MILSPHILSVQTLLWEALSWRDACLSSRWQYNPSEYIFLFPAVTQKKTAASVDNPVILVRRNDKIDF